MEFIALGPNLTGNVYDGGNLVATVAATHATYASGWSGIGAAINDNDTIGGPGGPLRTFIASQFDDVASVGAGTFDRRARPGVARRRGRDPTTPMRAD